MAGEHGNESPTPNFGFADALLAAATERAFADDGHTLDFINKAFECLDLIGWEHAQVKEDRNELRQARDDWRREAEKLYAEKLIDEKLAKLREADERRFAPRSGRTGAGMWRRLARA